jgi:hypothetical protein
VLRERFRLHNTKTLSMAEKEPETPDAGEGVMGLTEVEPSPVEETPAEFKEDYFPLQPTDAHPTRTSTLGLGNHGPAYYRGWCYVKYPNCY